MRYSVRENSDASWRQVVVVVGGRNFQSSILARMVVVDEHIWILHHLVFGVVDFAVVTLFAVVKESIHCFVVVVGDSFLLGAANIGPFCH